MRISTAQFYEKTAANYSKNFANVVKSSEEATSQVKINTAADDPVGAARLLQLGQQSAMLDQYSTNVTTIKSTLGQSESVMTSISNLLQSAKELTVGAGNGNFTDADRKANASALSQIEDQLFSLMNSKDENGQYLFSGSKGDTAPYVKNSDGTYSYQGDQTTLNLPVGDSLNMASNDTGWTVFEQAINTNRSQVSLNQPAAPAPPIVDDGRIVLSDGQVSSSVTYNSKFRSGEPYTVKFLDGTHFQILDSGNFDVTPEASKGGLFDPTSNAAQTVNFRGVDIQLNVNLKAGDDANALLTGRSYTLSAKADTFNSSRVSNNASTAQVTGMKVTDPALYAAQFPSGGAVVKFTGATTFDLYASPLTADSRPVSNGTLAGNVGSAGGVEFTFTGTPDAPGLDDQFVVKPNTHQTQNILDTISQFRTALNTPADGDPVALQKLNASLAAGIGNLASGMDQLSSAISSVGGRGQALEIQAATNESLGLANTATQSSIRDSDPAEVLTRLTLQQTMLQASQLAFSKIAQLGLFNKI